MILQDIFKSIIFQRGQRNSHHASSLSYFYRTIEHPLPRVNKQGFIFEAKVPMSLASREEQIMMNNSHYSLSEMTGTRTIANLAVIEGSRYQFGTKIITMLRMSSIKKSTVKTGKTYFSSTISGRILLTDNIFFRHIATTGSFFTMKNICSVLIPETHGKREYLGEFSLSREETNLVNKREEVRVWN